MRLFNLKSYFVKTVVKAYFSERSGFVGKNNDYLLERPKAKSRDFFNLKGLHLRNLVSSRTFSGFFNGAFDQLTAGSFELLGSNHLT